jgi:hypothetical protein
VLRSEIRFYFITFTIVTFTHNHYNVIAILTNTDSSSFCIREIGMIITKAVAALSVFTPGALPDKLLLYYSKNQTKNR